MNSIAKEIKNYWFEQSPYFMLDSEVLETITKTLSKDETLLLSRGFEDCCKDEKSKLAYIFTVNKAFNRHNDIITGATIIEDETILCSEKSSITELDITLETLKDCNKHCIYHVEDVEKDLLPGLSLEAIADLTAAIISYNSEHSIQVGD